ncbi:hypothetical protein THAOC_14732, partial [Thalassiosira oceanica]
MFLCCCPPSRRFSLADDPEESAGPGRAGALPVGVDATVASPPPPRTSGWSAGSSSRGSRRRRTGPTGRPPGPSREDRASRFPRAPVRGGGEDGAVPPPELLGVKSTGEDAGRGPPSRPPVLRVHGH